MITTEESSIVYDELTNKEKNHTLSILINARNNSQRIIGNPVDPPYYFYCTHKVMFDDITDEQLEEYLSINNADDFGFYTIWLISKYIIKCRSSI